MIPFVDFANHWHPNSMKLDDYVGSVLRVSPIPPKEIVEYN